MTNITIEHVGDTPRRKYGEVFNPGDKKEIPSDVLIAYSLMEISQNLNKIRHTSDKIGQQIQREEFDIIAGRHPKGIIVNQTFPMKVETHGWIERWFEKRRFRKTMKNIRKAKSSETT